MPADDRGLGAGPPESLADAGSVTGSRRPPGAAGLALGLPRVHHRLTDSTNQRAKELARDGAPSGTVVTAAEQQHGRGRHGRRWVAPAGRALLMSLILRQVEPFGPPLALAAGLAVCEACEACAEVSCSLKWPNDIWIDGHKVAGVLVDARPQDAWAVIGIGVNVETTAEELAVGPGVEATSLRVASGSRPDAAVPALLEALLPALAGRLTRAPEAIVAEFRTRDALLGTEVRWRDGVGRAAGVSPTGALLIETTAGARVEIDAGDISRVVDLAGYPSRRGN